jgi:hypothetical protein
VTVSASDVARYTRFFSSLAINVVIAVLGTATLQTAFGAMLHPHSVQSALWKATGLSLLFAFVLGALIYRFFENVAGKWVWIITTVWLAGRALLFLGAGFSSAYIWDQVSGGQCIKSPATPACGAIFFVFTIPFIRGIGYSAGMQLAAALLRRSAPEKHPLAP